MKIFWTWIAVGAVWIAMAVAWLFFGDLFKASVDLGLGAIFLWIAGHEVGHGKD